MAVPVSAGIGTGAAQVFGQDKTYEALKDASGTLLQVTEYKNKIAEKKEAEKKAAKERDLKAVSDLQLKLDFDRKGLKPADIEMTTKEVDELRKKYDGKWELIANGEPNITNEYNKDLDLLRGNVAKRSENYSLFKNQFLDISKNPQDYTKSQIDLAAQLYDRPDINMADYSGVFAKKINLGDPIGEILSGSNDIFFTKEYSSETDTGKKSFRGNIFKKEEESLRDWTNRVNSIPSKLQNLIAVYEDNPNVEKDASGRVTEEGMKTIYKISHDVAKSTLKESTSYTSITEDDKDGGAGSNKNVAVLTPFTNQAGEKGLTFTNVSGGTPKPMEFTTGKNKLSDLKKALEEARLKLQNEMLKKDKNEDVVKTWTNAVNKLNEEIKTTKAGDTYGKTTVSIMPVNLVKRKDGHWWISGYGTKTTYDEATNTTNTIKEDDISRNLSVDKEAAARILKMYEASSLDELYDKMKWSNR